MFVFKLHVSARTSHQRMNSHQRTNFASAHELRVSVRPPRAHVATNPAKNATFSATFVQEGGECCISCNNLGAMGFKPGSIARNVAHSTTMTRKEGLFPRFSCTKYNICWLSFYGKRSTDSAMRTASLSGNRLFRVR